MCYAVKDHETEMYVGDFWMTFYFFIPTLSHNKLVMNTDYSLLNVPGECTLS